MAAISICVEGRILNNNYAWIDKPAAGIATPFKLDAHDIQYVFGLKQFSRVTQAEERDALIAQIQTDLTRKESVS